MVKHSPELMHLVETQLGSDFPSAFIREVAEHMQECPECKIYIDSVHQIVKLYRETDTDKSIPSDVSERLFKILKLPA